jgi:hypothetical protein
LWIIPGEPHVGDPALSLPKVVVFQSPNNEPGLDALLNEVEGEKIQNEIHRHYIFIMGTIK